MSHLHFYAKLKLSSYRFVGRFQLRTLVPFLFSFDNGFKVVMLRGDLQSMLSKRQQHILQFVHQHTLEHGFAPSIREIGCVAGIPSTSVVNYHIERLVTLGYLMKSPGKSRAFVLTRIALEFLGNATPDDTAQKLREEIRLLKVENEQLCREYQTQLNMLRREYKHVLQELNQLRQTPARHPA
jgi:hypothetical protein